MCSVLTIKASDYFIIDDYYIGGDNVGQNYDENANYKSTFRPEQA